jgi:hypothetical protein
VQTPERLQPALAIDTFVVVGTGTVQQAAQLCHCAERVGALGPGATFGVVEVEAVGKHEDALVGKFDIHARSSPPRSLPRLLSKVAAGDTRFCLVDVGCDHFRIAGTLQLNSASRRNTRVLRNGTRAGLHSGPREQWKELA